MSITNVDWSTWRPRRNANPSLTARHPTAARSPSAGGIGRIEIEARSSRPIEIRSIAYAHENPNARDDDARERRPDQAGAVPDDLVEGGGGRQLGLVEQARGHRAAGGAVDRARRGDAGHGHVDQRERRVAVDGPREQQARGREVPDLRADQDLPTVERVQERAARQRSHHEREEPDQADQPDGDRRLGQAVHLEERRDDRELRPERRRRAARATAAGSRATRAAA